MHSLFPSWAIEAQKGAAAAAAQRMREEKMSQSCFVATAEKNGETRTGPGKNKNATTMLVRFSGKKLRQKYGKH